MAWTQQQLEAQLAVLIDAHEFASAPYHDQNDVKGYLTSRKREIRRQIAKAKEKDL